MTEKTISRVHVHVSPDSADTLVRKGRITNDHLIAYSQPTPLPKITKIS